MSPCPSKRDKGFLCIQLLRGLPCSSSFEGPVLCRVIDSRLSGSTNASFLRSLFPLATIVTPNLPEASALLGGRPIQDVAAMEAAARDLHALGPQHVLVKGGHLDAGARAWRSSLHMLSPKAPVEARAGGAALSLRSVGCRTLTARYADLPHTAAETGL